MSEKTPWILKDKYRASQEEVQQDRKAFYEKFGENGGKEPGYIHWDPNRVARRWALMLETQNGDNFDDYHVLDGNKVEQYVGQWCPPPAKLLLMGVGTGREVKVAQTMGYDVVGTTLGKENRAFASWKLGISLDYVDNCTLPYPSKAFDVAAGFQLLEHCHAPYLFLFECCRVLKEGGVLILEWPPYIMAREGEQLSNMMASYNDDNLHHACCWTPAQARILVRRCGFEDVEVFVHPRLHKSLIPLTKDDPAYWSNISAGNLVLRAKRRKEADMPGYSGFGRRLIDG